MIRTTLCALGLVLLALGAAPVQSETLPPECGYASWGPVGELAIRNAEGKYFYVVDSSGAVVAAGAVPSGDFGLVLMGVVPGPIMVGVGADVVLATSDRESDWQ